MLKNIALVTLLLLLAACGNDAVDPQPADSSTPTTVTGETSQPAPGTSPDQVSVRGTLDYGLIEAGDLQQTAGCAYHLQPTGVGGGYLVSIDVPRKIAQVMIDNEIQTLSMVEHLPTAGSEERSIMIFKGEKAKMEVQVTDSNREDADGFSVSGKVHISTLNGELNADVTGEYGC